MPFEAHILTIATFLPLVGSLVIAFLPREAHSRVRYVALAFSILTFIVTLGLILGFDRAQGGFQWVEDYAWIQSPSIHYHLGIDGLSLILVVLTGFLTPLSILVSWTGITERVKEFHILVLALEAGCIGVFVSLDLFLFFVFWEVMLIPMYFLIGIWGHGRKVYAAVKFILYTMVGSALMLVGIIFLYERTGSFDYTQILSALSSGSFELSHNVESLLFWAFFLAFAIKVPLFPLHTWLPDAHTEAPTAGSVMLAGVLLKMGTYGILRFCLPLFPGAAREFATLISWLAVIGIIYGALVSMVQPDLKRLVAYSSVAHLGYVVLGIFAFNFQGAEGAIYQMANHGVSTGALFMMVGMLYDRRHTRLIKDFGGLATTMPVFSAFFMIVTLSSLGLPMLNGFVGEFLIILGSFHARAVYGSLAAVGVILAAVYLLWMYQRVFLGEVTDEKNREIQDCNTRERWMLTVAVAVIIFMGVYPQPFLRQMDATVAQVLTRVNPDAVSAQTEKPPQAARPLRGTESLGSERIGESLGGRASRPLSSYPLAALKSTTGRTPAVPGLSGGQTR
ncbi:MAG TPA: NADH-quinone oxidoreductase subunit M [Terriglobia bacterium]|nr:NADH-quinone oxidoreductase subunit M [Terriglobia bacterium]